MVNYERKLIELVTHQAWMMDVLKHARDAGLPDWYIAAGTIRNTVWNHLHGFPTTLYQKDVDLIYYDAEDKPGERGKRGEAAKRFLEKTAPRVTWDIVNQAWTHLFYYTPVRRKPQVSSAAEAIAYWSEIPTCVGINLEEDDSLTVYAPHSLTDLFELRVKPVPPPYQDLELDYVRLKEKKWRDKWPKLRIETPK